MKPPDMEEMVDAIMSLDLSEMPEWAARKFRLAQERPDLLWDPDDTEADIERKTAEFNALLISREPKH